MQQNFGLKLKSSKLWKFVISKKMFELGFGQLNKFNSLFILFQTNMLES